MRPHAEDLDRALFVQHLIHQPVLDIFSIAIGFVLRVYAGATALDVPVSSWMFITTFSLALYLAAAGVGRVDAGGLGRPHLPGLSLRRQA